jgi:ATP-dependent helicase/nuclease subunit B
MDVVFGLRVDGGAAPDHGGGDGGALGKPVVGPSGLLDILETATGLGSPPVAQVVRIAAFQSVLERLQGDRFWSRSLAMDPWATARTLLQWRDELVGLGWRPAEAWAGRRLADLAAAAQVASDLPYGIADRTARLLYTLTAEVALPVRRIRLIDPLEVRPSGLRRLINRLEELGIAVEPIEYVPAAPEGTALGRLQRWMLAGGIPPTGADGTVTIAKCSSAPLAAEVLGQWFAAREPEPLALVAQEGDTASITVCAVLANPAVGAAGRRRTAAPPSAPAARLQGCLEALRSACAHGAAGLRWFARAAAGGVEACCRA